MSLVDTLIDPLRSGYSGKLDAFEYRKSKYGALAAFQAQSSGTDKILSDEDIANIKKSYGIQTKIPVLDFRDVTIGSVRSCIVPTDASNSRMVVLTFVSYVFGFTMIPSLYVNNDVKYELDFQKKMQAYILKLLKIMDQASVNKLNTDRNIFFDGLTAEYPVLANAFQVPKASRKDVFNQLIGIMSASDYTSNQYDVVLSSMTMPLVNELARNGTNNADNTLATLNGYRTSYSNNITNNAGVRDTMFVIPQGTLAIANRNDPDARAGTSLNGGGNKWDEVDMPQVGMRMGSYYTEKCTDATQIYATAETQGLTRAAMQGFEFSTDVTYVTSYISNRAARYAPIMKVEISA